MCAKFTEGANNAEGRNAAGCEWREAEEGDKACEEHQGECQRRMESLSWWRHYCMTEEWMSYTRVSYVCAL